MAVSVMTDLVARPSGTFAVFSFLLDAAPDRIANFADNFRHWCDVPPSHAHALIAEDLEVVREEYVDRWKVDRSRSATDRCAARRIELGRWFGRYDSASHEALRESLRAVSEELVRLSCARLGSERRRCVRSVRAFIAETEPIDTPGSVDESEPVLEQHSTTSSSDWWAGGKNELRLVKRVAETHDVFTYEFEATDGRLFRYLPGQSVAMTFEIDGESVKRSYTISSSPTRPNLLHLTIKRVPGGLVSNWLADNAKVGDVFACRGPNGRFSCANEAPQKMLLLSGGSGITPVLSMTRYCHDLGLDVDIVFVHAARRPADLIAADELAWYERRMRSFRTLYVLSRTEPEDRWDGLTGFFNATMLYGHIPDFAEREVYLCGPMPFMNAMKDVFGDSGYNMDHFHYESFGGATKRRPPRNTLPAIAVAELVQRVSPRELVTASGSSPLTRTAAPLAPSSAKSSASSDVSEGTTQGFSVTLNGTAIGTVHGKESLLEEIEDAGGEIESSCRAGTCGTCKVRCSSGEVEFENEGGLSDDEADEGFILTCVARAKSDLRLELTT